MNRTKSVIVIDASLALGVQVNAAAILAATLGQRVESLIGSDVADASGEMHLGLIHVPLPVLVASNEKIAEIRNKATALIGEGDDDTAKIIVADFSKPAQVARTYEEYTESIGGLAPDEIEYLGVALYGDAKQVSKLTGSLSLLR